MVGEGRGEADVEGEGKEEGEEEGEGDPLGLCVPRMRVGDREEMGVLEGGEEAETPPLIDGVGVGVKDPPTPNPAVIEGVGWEVPVGEEVLVPCADSVASIPVLVGEGPREAERVDETNEVLLPGGMEAVGVGREVEEGVGALEALPTPPPLLALSVAEVKGEREEVAVAPKGGEAVKVPPLCMVAVAVPPG